MDQGTTKRIATRAIVFSSTLFLSFAIVGFLPSTRARRQAHFTQAAADGNLRRMRLLHMTGANVNTRSHCCVPLFLAAGEGRLDAVRFLLDEGADVNARDQHGRTAITEAAFYGNLAVIKELTLRGADVNAITGEGTALDIALKANNAAASDLLRHYGAKRACEIRGSC